MSREQDGAKAPARQVSTTTHLIQQANEALEFARQCDQRGDRVGWILAVTLAAQYVQLTKLLKRGAA